jgi:hypothetical protein
MLDKPTNNFIEAVGTIALLQFQILAAQIKYVRDEMGRFAKTAGDAIPSDLYEFPSDDKFEKAEVFDISKHSSRGRSQIGGVEIDGKRFFVKEVLHDQLDEGAAETVASDVAKTMGLENDIVPAKKVSIKGQEFIASHYLPGQSVLSAGTNLKSAISQPKARMMLLFDFVINNTDRHADNVYIPDGGTPKLIDHGNSMMYEMGSMGDGDADLVFKHNQIYDKHLKLAPNSEFTDEEIDAAIKGIDKLQESAKSHFKNSQQLENILIGSEAIRTHLKDMLGKKELMKVVNIIL